ARALSRSASRLKRLSVVVTQPETNSPRSTRIGVTSFTVLSFTINKHLIFRLCAAIKSGVDLLHSNVALTSARTILYPTHQLTTGRNDIVATSGPNGCDVASHIKNGLKPASGIHAWPFKIAFRKRVERYQINLARQILEQLHQFTGVFRLIVHTLNNRVFDSRLTFLRQSCKISLGGCQQFRYRILFIQWNQLVAQFIIGCMK